MHIPLSALFAGCLLSFPWAAAAAPPCAEGMLVRTANDVILPVGRTPSLGQDSLCRFRRLGDGMYFDTFMGMRDIPLGRIAASPASRPGMLEEFGRVVDGALSSAEQMYLPLDPPAPYLSFVAETWTLSAGGTEQIAVAGCTLQGRVFLLRREAQPTLKAHSTSMAGGDGASMRTIGTDYRYVLHPTLALALRRQERALLPDDSNEKPWSAGEQVISGEGLCPAGG